MRYIWDIESTGLLDSTSIDYSASPYKLLDSFKIHCIVAKDIDSKERHVFVGDEVKTEFPKLLETATMLIGHNQINFDLLAIKLYLGIDYEIGEVCTLNGKPITIFDSLVASKVLNPDRYGGHSIEAWGKRCGFPKIDWRAKAVELGLIPFDAPSGAEFAKYHPDMLEYCIRDVDVNEVIYFKILEEWGTWNWSGPFALEQQVADIITRQQHRGFWFNQELAEENIRDLDAKMDEIKAIVEPLLPPKPMGVTKLKAFYPPKTQFKRSGEVSEVMKKWVAKHNGELQQEGDDWYAQFPNSPKHWKLPMDGEVPIQTHEPASVKDTTHIKGWLVELGWRPTQYKERDLTCDAKKNKLTREKYIEVAYRYTEQTLNSPFCKDRCDELGVSPKKLMDKLLKHDLKRPMKVYTNPTITVGVEKEIDPALLELADKFPHAKLVSDYLTYSHRRNSILGGGADPDELDEDDDFAGKGFLVAVRPDGRIPTPADPCGAATSRMKHKICANIPRVTSLYGENMRAMFGSDVSAGHYQVGYDFASLEAMIEAHYCWRYDDEDKAYCLSLTKEKPNDVHTITAKKISEIIGRLFTRPPAKNVKYCCAYGGQPPRVAKTVGCDLSDGKKIYDAYWEAAFPLARLAEKLKAYWETIGGKKFILGLDGRKIPTRSASALINSLLQSAGVICAKRAMVLHDRKLRAKGLIVDFFKDDWKNLTFVQQLIAYHDECQLESHKSLIKWRVFETEEAAKEFKKDHHTWSEIGHSDKGYYVGWCEAGELIQEAVRETSEYYDLNVTLAADYILGRNWAECH